MMYFNILCWFTLLVLFNYIFALNDRPIIGILSQEPTPNLVEGEVKNYTSFIAASYVKFIESVGARVVPIKINKNEQYYKHIASSVNGILFPGGSSSIYNISGYGRAGQYLYNEVLQRNALGYNLPLWTTCLGFEMLMYLESDFEDFRVRYNASNIALPLEILEDISNSEMFLEMPDDVLKIFLTENVTSNFHHFCFTIKDVQKHGFDENYYLLTTNHDEDNLEFLSTFQHKKLPIYGTQWHPEKNAFEWRNDAKSYSIPHSMNAVYSVQYMAEFFIKQARLNNQRFENEKEEERELIYNYQTKYFTKEMDSSYIQIYLFED